MKAVLLDAALAAGHIQLQYFKKDVAVDLKGTDNPVTIADKECEEKIIAILRKHSDYNIIGEESGKHTTDSDYTWIIDPIDGTSNFSRGIAFFCTSIALAKGNDVLMGVIYNPVLDEVFFAEKGKGASLNGKQLTVKKQMNNILGFGKGNDPAAQTAYIRALQHITKKYTNSRSLGACALELAYTAAGRLDSMLSYGDQVWDYAAGSLIAAEAGCTVTTPDGKPWSLAEKHLLVCTPQIHNEIVQLLK